MHVYSNSAITLDGRIASVAVEQPSFGSRHDLRYLSVLRARADAVLVGGRTFRNWPKPLVPHAASIAALRRDGFPDTEHPPLEGRQWWNIVLSRTLDVPRSGPFYEDLRVRPLFFAEDPAGEAPPGAEVEIGSVTVPGVLRALAARGVERLLVEAGGELLYAFLAADALDEMYVTICPVLYGGQTAPGLVGGRGFTPEEARRLRLLHLNRFGDELFCRYEVRRTTPE